jgi:hypothetical protein
MPATVNCAAKHSYTAGWQSLQGNRRCFPRVMKCWHNNGNDLSNTLHLHVYSKFRDCVLDVNGECIMTNALGSKTGKRREKCYLNFAEFHYTPLRLLSSCNVPFVCIATKLLFPILR